MKMCFSKGKLMKQFGKALFMNPLFVQILKTNPPLIVGGGNYESTINIGKITIKIIIFNDIVHNYQRKCNKKRTFGYYSNEDLQEVSLT